MCLDATESRKSMSLRELHLRTQEIATKLGLVTPTALVQSSLTFADMGNQTCTLLKADNLVALEWLVTQGISVDFCYIDPPYNTGNKFIYNDSRSQSTNTIWSRHHDWLVFMLPRLVAAHMVMESHGVIAISIDDYEYPYLKILMDHIFGETNYIATLVVCRSKNGKGGKANVAVNHEYVLVYGKSQSSGLTGLEETDLTRYNKEDENGRYCIDGLFRKKGDASKREDRPNMYYPLYYSSSGEVYTSKQHSDLKEVYPVDSKGVERRWLWGKGKATEESWKLYASPSGVVYVKNYSQHQKRIKLRSILNSDSYLNDRAASELKVIFKEKIFETPKPLSLIKDLIDCCSSSDATVLDFFAGTGTTAHAVQSLNEEKPAFRKCILVEHKQLIPVSHVASSSGFKSIADITEYRLKVIKGQYPSFDYRVVEL